MLSFDHLVIAGPNLAELTRAVEAATGVKATPGGPHLGLGTTNQLIGIDADTYIELIGPDPDQPEPIVPRPFGIDTIEEPALRGWVLAVPDLEQACAATAAAGLAPGVPVDMSRQKPDGTILEWKLAVPPADATGGVLPVVIDWGQTAHPASSLDQGLSVENFELTHPDPGPIADAISRISGETIEIATGPIKLSVTLRGPGGDFRI